MKGPQQQKKLLAVLLLVLFGFSSYRLLQRTGDEVVVGRRLASDGADGRQLENLKVPRLNLQDLRREKATYKPGRNPFRFGPPPEPPKQASPPPRRRPTARPKRVKTEAAPPVRQSRPKPPKVDFVYLGSFGPEERRIAVFSRDDEIYNVLAGDVLFKRFIVDKIGFESADIRFVEFPDAPETRLEAGG